MAFRENDNSDSGSSSSTASHKYDMHAVDMEVALTKWKRQQINHFECYGLCQKALLGMQHEMGNHTTQMVVLTNSKFQPSDRQKLFQEYSRLKLKVERASANEASERSFGCFSLFGKKRNSHHSAHTHHWGERYQRRIHPMSSQGEKYQPRIHPMSSEGKSFSVQTATSTAATHSSSWKIVSRIGIVTGIWKHRKTGRCSGLLPSSVSSMTAVRIVICHGVAHNSRPSVTKRSQCGSLLMISTPPYEFRLYACNDHTISTVLYINEVIQCIVDRMSTLYCTLRLMCTEQGVMIISTNN